MRLPSDRFLARRRVQSLLTAALVSTLLMLAASAGAAVSFDALLAQTRSQAKAEGRRNAEREAVFQTALGRQQQALKEALAARDAAEATSNALSAQFDANEVRVQELKVLLKQHEGNLGELFGVTRQVAGDAASVLRQSLITTEFPAAGGEEDRDTFLRRLAGAKALPSITELERLWFEFQREMTAGARVARYAAPVVEPDGSRNARQVLRIGPFTAVERARTLAYLPEQQSLAVLPRQPRREIVAATERLDTAPPGTYVPAVVDPARGALMALYVARPNMIERIEGGQLVGYVILGVGALGAIAAAIQYVYLIFARIVVAMQLRNPERPRANNPLGRVLLAVKGRPEAGIERPEVIELRISEAVLREVPRLERFQSFLRLAVAAGPLLGLIGTVIGMIITFQSITASGASDPRLMADGIGQAMIATVLGLGIAIPLLFVNAGLGTLSGGLVQTLDEQSTALLAEQVKGYRQG